MGTVVLRRAVNRKEGYLYYVDGDGNVCEARMRRQGRRKHEDEEKETIEE